MIEPTELARFSGVLRQRIAKPTLGSLLHQNSDRMTADLD